MTTKVNRHPELSKYLVVSYDPDQQQWFYDVVLALSADAAKEWVCAVREYVIDADVLTIADLARMTRRVESVSHAQVERDMATQAAEAAETKETPCPSR